MCGWRRLPGDKPPKPRNGSAGNVSARHLGAPLLGQTAGIKVKHVPNKGAGPAVNDLVGGHIGFTVTTTPSAIGLIESDTLKALAVTGDKLHEFDAWLEAKYLSDKARKDRWAWNFGIQRGRPITVRESRQWKPACP
ncbi:tripartite tricarboxylate transporter substrate-binding protein [Ensifer sp. MJa1]|uniref:tripartite tricarboxylate transporter substrate-binding protein n=1 Tax=Ensifer sp. MJa1 TaxID=2919888 RepID=UPI003A2C3FED